MDVRSLRLNVLSQRGFSSHSLVSHLRLSQELVVRWVWEFHQKKHKRSVPTRTHVALQRLPAFFSDKPQTRPSTAMDMLISFSTVHEVRGYFKLVWTLRAAFLFASVSRWSSVSEAFDFTRWTECVVSAPAVSWPNSSRCSFDLSLKVILPSESSRRISHGLWPWPDRFSGDSFLRKIA